MCMDPSLTGFYRVGQKLSDIILVLLISPRVTEPSTVSVFLSVVRCGRVCRAQICAHSGIEPSRLTKKFPQDGPKNSLKNRIFDHFENLRPYISATVINRGISNIGKNALFIPYPTVACVWTHRPGWSKK